MIFFQKRGIFMPNVSSPWALIRIISQCRNLRHGYRSTKLRIDIVDNVFSFGVTRMQIKLKFTLNDICKYLKTKKFFNVYNNTKQEN